MQAIRNLIKSVLIGLGTLLICALVASQLFMGSILARQTESDETMLDTIIRLKNEPRSIQTFTPNKSLSSALLLLVDNSQYSETWSDNSNLASDTWLRFDVWYLEYAAPLTVEISQMILIGVSPEDAAFALYQAIGYVYEAAKLIGKHPNWTSEDILLELEGDPFLGNTDKGFVRYLHHNKMSQSDVKKRERMLEKGRKRCLNEISNIPPTKRPPNPAKECIRRILERSMDPFKVPEPTPALARVEKSKEKEDRVQKSPEPEENRQSTATTYRVIGVDRADTLNVRSEPNHRSSIVAALPWNARNIEVSNCQTINNGQNWCLVGYQGTKGWVNSSYLEIEC